MSVDADHLMADVETLLEEFDERAGGVVAVVLLMRTGLPVAARIRAHVDETFLSASLATLLNVSMDLSDKLFTLIPARIMLDTEAGSLILQGINDDMVMAAVFKKQHLGAVLLLVEQTAKKLSRLFRST